jgi:membrane protease YdiL (CAAX protease family)
VTKRIEAVLERVYPGMGWRPLWLSALATWAFVLYYHHGQPRVAPAWFIELGTGLTGIEVVGFHQHGWAHLTAVLLLFLIPMGICWLAEGWTPVDLGFRVRGTKREFLIVLGMWLTFIPVIWLFSGTEAFDRTYPRLGPAETDAALFFYYQAFYLVKWTSWEFFFRGFILFGFEHDFGIKAVLVSCIPYALVHVGKPEMEMISAFLGGLILCAIALKSRRLWPGVFLHSTVATTMDFFASAWWAQT